MHSQTSLVYLEIADLILSCQSKLKIEIQSETQSEAQGIFFGLLSSIFSEY